MLGGCLVHPSRAQVSRKLGKAETVQNPLRWHATLARHLDAPMRQIDLTGRMGVGIDAHHATKLEGALMPAPVKVEAPRVGVHFNGKANRLRTR